MRWVGYAPHMGKQEIHNLEKGGDHFGHLGIDGRITLKCILKKIRCEGVNCHKMGSIARVL
jgi:hypothetical protein